MDVTEVESALGVCFVNKHLLLQAITHRSYLNEHRDWPVPHYERLEFLGDAVLEIIVTEHLFHEFPESMEGELTKMRSNLVGTEMLATRCCALGLQEYELTSHGEQKARVKATKRRHACLYEAVVGALFLDQGPEAAREFVLRTLVKESGDNLLKQDAKSRLQELAQANLSVTPTYKVIEESGPVHAASFIIGVYLRGPRLVAKGTGGSKQEAEIKAAESALIVKGWTEVSHA